MARAPSEQFQGGEAEASRGGAGLWPPGLGQGPSQAPLTQDCLAGPVTRPLRLTSCGQPERGLRGGTWLPWVWAAARPEEWLACPSRLWVGFLPQIPLSTPSEAPGFMLLGLGVPSEVRSWVLVLSPQLVRSGGGVREGSSLLPGASPLPLCDPVSAPRPHSLPSPACVLLFLPLSFWISLISFFTFFSLTLSVSLSPCVSVELTLSLGFHSVSAPCPSPSPPLFIYCVFFLSQ